MSNTNMAFTPAYGGNYGGAYNSSGAYIAGQQDNLGGMGNTVAGVNDQQQQYQPHQPQQQYYQDMNGTSNGYNTAEGHYEQPQYQQGDVQYQSTQYQNSAEIMPQANGYANDPGAQQCDAYQGNLLAPRRPSFHLEGVREELSDDDDTGTVDSVVSVILDVPVVAQDQQYQQPVEQHQPSYDPQPQQPQAEPQQNQKQQKLPKGTRRSSGPQNTAPARPEKKKKSLFKSLFSRGGSKSPKPNKSRSDEAVNPKAQKNGFFRFIASVVDRLTLPTQRALDSRKKNAQPPQDTQQPTEVNQAPQCQEQTTTQNASNDRRTSGSQNVVPVFAAPPPQFLSGQQASTANATWGYNEPAPLPGTYGHVAENAPMQEPQYQQYHNDQLGYVNTVEAPTYDAYATAEGAHHGQQQYDQQPQQYEQQIQLHQQQHQLHQQQQHAMPFTASRVYSFPPGDQNASFPQAQAALDPLACAQPFSNGYNDMVATQPHTLQFNQVSAQGWPGAQVGGESFPSCSVQPFDSEPARPVVVYAQPAIVYNNRGNVW